MKHTPLIRYQAARRALELAQEACPHWDWAESGSGPCGHECCYAVDDAKRELRLARKAVQS